MYRFISLESANVNEKRVFVRCDFDIPLVDARGPASSNSAGPVSLLPRPTSSSASGRTAGARRGSPALTTRSENYKSFAVADDTRLVSSISTIEYLLEQGATVIAAGHIGRPSLPNSKIKSQKSNLSLEPVAEWFAEEFPGSSLYKTEIDGFSAWQIKRNFYILENLRFYKGEEENSGEFAEKLAGLADLYVNEAFGSSHREHASIVGVAKLLPHFAGFHLAKEIKILTSILESPKRPLTVIIGGAKIETKLPLVEKMHRFADYVLVGGEIAEQDKVLIKEQHQNIASQKALLLVADLNPQKSDITNVSLENFLQIVSRSACVVWNGPLGEISNFKFQISNLGEGDGGYTSLKLAEAIVKSSAYKVVGGGDTVAFLNKHNLLSKFDFVSVGGGAMLEFLSGNSLPGLLALQK